MFPAKEQGRKLRVFATDIFFVTFSLSIQAGDPYLKSRSCPQSEMENN